MPVGGRYPHFHTSYRYYGPYWGRGFYDPWDRPTDYREVTRFEATAEIIMGKGPKPDDPEFFDAEDVLMNLSGRIQRPETG